MAAVMSTDHRPVTPRLDPGGRLSLEDSSAHAAPGGHCWQGAARVSSWAQPRCSAGRISSPSCRMAQPRPRSSPTRRRPPARRRPQRRQHRPPMAHRPRRRPPRRRPPLCPRFPSAHNPPPTGRLPPPRRRLDGRRLRPRRPPSRLPSPRLRPPRRDRAGPARLPESRKSLRSPSPDPRRAHPGPRIREPEQARVPGAPRRTP